MPSNYIVFPGLQKLLFSPRCRSCGKGVLAQSGFCFGCKRELKRALSADPHYLLRFEGAVPALFHGLREAAPHRSAELLLELLWRSGRLAQFIGVDGVVPAPQSARDGPSGLKLFCRALAERLDARFLDLLVKTGGRTQHGRSFSERVNSACFVEVGGGNGGGEGGQDSGDPQTAGKTLLVIDDVLTTGTTLEMAAYALRKAGARKVITFALAHQVMECLEGKGEEAHEESDEVNPFLLHLGV